MHLIAANEACDNLAEMVMGKTRCDLWIGLIEGGRLAISDLDLALNRTNVLVTPHALMARRPFAEMHTRFREVCRVRCLNPSGISIGSN